jgi:hypothetical protein
MRFYVGLFVASVACADGVLAQGTWEGASRRPMTPRAFEEIYQRFLDGLRQGDTLGYRDLLTADYRYVGEADSRVIIGRSARLVRDAEARDSLTELVVERCDLATRATVAVGPCWFRMKGRSSGEVGEWRGVSLTTFVLDGDRWRIAATRPSAIPPK